jgi:hypothetical protein
MCKYKIYCPGDKKTKCKIVPLPPAPVKETEDNGNIFGR